MHRFEWNALRVGDDVLLHVRKDQGFPVERGVVAFVDEKRGDNDVGVRLSAIEHQGRVIRPSRLSAHLVPFDVDAECWRCGRAPADADSGTP